MHFQESLPEAHSDEIVSLRQTHNPLTPGSLSSRLSASHCSVWVCTGNQHTECSESDYRLCGKRVQSRIPLRELDDHENRSGRRSLVTRFSLSLVWCKRNLLWFGSFCFSFYLCSSLSDFSGRSEIERVSFSDIPTEDTLRVENNGGSTN